MAAVFVTATLATSTMKLPRITSGTTSKKAIDASVESDIQNPLFETTQGEIVLTDEHLEFLDSLRRNGQHEMIGALPSLLDAYPDLAIEDARRIICYWADTYHLRVPGAD